MAYAIAEKQLNNVRDCDYTRCNRLVRLKKMSTGIAYDNESRDDTFTTFVAEQRNAQDQAQAKYIALQLEQTRFQALQLAQCGEPAAETVARAQAYLAFLLGSPDSTPS